MRSIITVSFLLCLPILGYSQKETTKNERVSVKNETSNQTTVQSAEPETQTNERVVIKKKAPKKRAPKGEQINARTSKNKEE